MLTTKEVRSVRVCHGFKPGKEVDKNGVPRRHRKIGKVFKTVFSPDGLKVVGFIVRRPDLLWMIKRPEKFLALDAMDVQDGVIVPTMGSKSWDDEAIKRLGIDWDRCIIWEGMEVKTTGGAEIGRVDELSFDERTGELNSLFLDDGATSRALLGSIEIPAELMVGYKKGILIVKPEAKSLLPSGGLAAKAGEASAAVSAKASETQKAATEATAKAIEAGTVGVGKGVGRIKRSVTGAVDGFKKESGIGEKKPAAKSSSGSAKKSSSGSSSGAKKTTSAKSSSSSKSSSTDAKKAVTNHLKSAGSMFSDFKKEFDKAKK
jgi:sporulation protein YlmC with PRC-barrel domain